MLSTPPSRNFRRLIPVTAVVAALGVLALAGCSKSDKKNPLAPGGGGGGGATTTTFVGTFTSGTNSGKLTVTVATTSLTRQLNVDLAARVTVNATGACLLGGVTTNLTGQYDPGAHNFTVAGGGYSFSGDYEPSGHVTPVLAGAWTGPSATSGEFVCSKGASSAINVYTGIYHSTTSPPDSGTFSMCVTDTLLSGFAHGSNSSSGGAYFEGKVSASGNPRTITINYDGGAYTLAAPGNLNTTTNTVSGSYTFTDVAGGGGVDNGNWAGKLEQ